MLRQLLQAMLDEASHNEGTVVKKKLKGNLHVALVVTKKNVQISVARDNTYPSLSEWKMTLANFPYVVPAVEPKSFIDTNRRFAMRGKLPRREDVPQQMSFRAPESNENSGQ